MLEKEQKRPLENLSTPKVRSYLINYQRMKFPCLVFPGSNQTVTVLVYERTFSSFKQLLILLFILFMIIILFFFWVATLMLPYDVGLIVYFGIRVS